jgi:hypothetical protein
MIYLSSWTITGVSAYMLAFALIESAVIFLALVLVGAILPAQLFRNKIVALGSVIVFITSGWAIAAHYNNEVIRSSDFQELSRWLLLYLASILVPYLLIQRFKRLEVFVSAFADRLTVLLLFYVPFGVLGMIIVLIRNVSGGVSR